LKALENIQMPVPPFDKQVWFNALVTKLSAICAAQLETQRELDALMPAVLDRAFRREL
jgi:type I restriction enzyme, S subunit